MKRVITLLGLGVCVGLRALPAVAAETAAPAPSAVEFPLNLAILDPDSPDKLPPSIIVFEEGKDQDGKDVRGPVGRLKSLRGLSKMFPDSNTDAGLPVVLRGLRLHHQPGADSGPASYEIELLGEFNAIKVPASPDEVKKLLAGQAATLTLKGAKNYGVYSYVSTTKFTLQLAADKLLIQGIEADFTFREGFYTYVSKTKKLSPPKSRGYLYRGERAELPALPSI